MAWLHACNLIRVFDRIRERARRITTPAVRLRSHNWKRERTLLLFQNLQALGECMLYLRMYGMVHRGVTIKLSAREDVAGTICSDRSDDVESRIQSTDSDTIKVQLQLDSSMKSTKPHQ